jgi:lipopolysaccharide/colanic/teichoic acid biosynthesis glycosyltransferase
MSTRTQNFVLIAVLVLLDACMILLGWWLAYELRLDSDFFPYYGNAKPEQARDVVLLTLPLWLGIFALCRLYDREELLGGPQEYGNVVKGCLIGFAALIIVSMFARMPDLARGWLVLGLVLVTLSVGSMRFGVRRAFYSLRRYGWFVQRALIVGTNDDARAIAKQLTPARNSGVQVLGFVDDYLPVGTVIAESLRVVASTPMLHGVTHELRVDQVILVSGAMTWESFDQLLRGITVSNEDRYAIKLSPGLYETLTTGVRVSYKNRVPLLEIERAPITGIDALLKGMMDYGLGTLMFVLTLPLLLLFALLLRFYARQPVLQSAEVLGKRGQPFKMHLLKSVSPSAVPWTRGNRFGQFLFATGLNKLPQLWMVLRGRMSLVGPRPVESSLAMSYQSWLPNLLSLKPGMTGARASSAENSITLEHEMRLELYYARNYSIWLDLQILFQTARRMLKRERVLRKPDPEATALMNEWQVSMMPPS